jgi:prepilin signal peptidase PulO-like enzyme (type II secretory pathway)
MMVGVTAFQRSLTRSRILPKVAVVAGFVASLCAVLLRGPEAYRGLLAFGYLALLFLMAMHDIRSLRVPNLIVYPALVFGVAASLTLGRSDAAEALLGGALAFLMMVVVVIIGRGAMGFADVKVGCLCGIVVGLGGVLPMLAIAFISAACVAGLLLVLRIRKPKDAIAFTPFLVAATAFSLSFYPLYLVS